MSTTVPTVSPKRSAVDCATAIGSVIVSDLTNPSSGSAFAFTVSLPGAPPETYRTVSSSCGAQSKRSHAGSASFAGGFRTGSRWSYCRVIEVCDTRWLRASGRAARFAEATEEMSEADFGYAASVETGSAEATRSRWAHCALPIRELTMKASDFLVSAGTATAVAAVPAANSASAASTRRAGPSSANQRGVFIGRPPPGAACRRRRPCAASATPARPARAAARRPPPRPRPAPAGPPRSPVWGSAPVRSR